MQQHRNVRRQLYPDVSDAVGPFFAQYPYDKKQPVLMRIFCRTGIIVVSFHIAQILLGVTDAS
jgi:hypothetical protein